MRWTLFLAARDLKDAGIVPVDQANTVMAGGPTKMWQIHHSDRIVGQNLENGAWRRLTQGTLSFHHRYRTTVSAQIKSGITLCHKPSINRSLDNEKPRQRSVDGALL